MGGHGASMYQCRGQLPLLAACGPPGRAVMPSQNKQWAGVLAGTSVAPEPEAAPPWQAAGLNNKCSLPSQFCSVLLALPQLLDGTANARACWWA